MTFEEFFLKKKIDLETFEVSNPSLFSEFNDHFSQMSDKSFDHTKKYWFNELRHQFPLSDEKEIRLKESFKPTEIPESAITEEVVKTTASAKPAGFKPRFKVPVAKEKPSEEPEIKEDNTLAQKPIGFTPKFKESPILGDKQESAEVTKPSGFKPRFKAGVTASVEKKEDTSLIEESKKEIPDLTKPAGFKPRFKAGVTAVAAINEEITKEEIPEVSKPTGFKPRFKPGVTPQKNKDIENE
ncbi:MAG: hypothetical protein ABIP95_04810 [Pelobium sp.]